MDHKKYGDAVISGSGRLTGGTYSNVKVSGSSVIDGDINAQDIKVSGSAKFWGNVSSRSVKVSGSVRFDGNVETGECKISGSADVEGNLHARSIKTSGSLNGHESVRAEEIKISGHLYTEGDVEAESFEASGGFKIRGLLNASQIRISMNGLCFAREIGGDRIEAKLAPLNLFWRFVVWAAEWFNRGSRFGLRSELIEGTFVALEWAEAKVVRGQAVEIGRGCNIGLLEYSESVWIDPQANVQEVRQIV